MPGLDDSYEQARSAADAAADRIVVLRPATIQEALAKYAVLLASYGDANGEDIVAAPPFFRFLQDLEHLAEAS